MKKQKTIDKAYSWSYSWSESIAMLIALAGMIWGFWDKQFGTYFIVAGTWLYLIATKK